MKLKVFLLAAFTINVAAKPALLHAETDAFKKITKQKNVLPYASSVDGTQFWLDWELVDKAPKARRYTRAIFSEGEKLEDFNVDCVGRRVSWVVNEWVEPTPGSINEIIFGKICGVTLGEHTFIFGGTFSDMDVYVSAGTARYVEGVSGLFDITTTTSRPIGSFVAKNNWPNADYETVRIDCVSYRGYISQPHKITAKADFSSATQMQFDRELILFKRICDPEGRLIGRIQNAADSSSNKGEQAAPIPRDVNSIIRRCIASGKSPGTASFTACVNSVEQ